MLLSQSTQANVCSQVTSHCHMSSMLKMSSHAGIYVKIHAHSA